MKKRKSPCTPYREKAKGKEVNPSIIAAGLSRATRAHVSAYVAAAVEDALVEFCGTRGPAPSDEALWAKFAWTCGYETLLDAIDQGLSEMRAHRTAVPDTKKPSVLQSILNHYWRKI